VFVVDSSTPESVKVGHVAEIVKRYLLIVVFIMYYIFCFIYVGSF
jgi:hypothetical protein